LAFVFHSSLLQRVVIELLLLLMTMMMMMMMMQISMNARKASIAATDTTLPVSTDQAPTYVAVQTAIN